MTVRLSTSDVNKDVTSSSALINPPKASVQSSFSICGKKIITQLTAFGNAITERVNAILAKMHSIVDSLRGRAHIQHDQNVQSIPDYSELDLEQVDLDDISLNQGTLVTTAQKTQAFAPSLSPHQPVISEPLPVLPPSIPAEPQPISQPQPLSAAVADANPNPVLLDQEIVIEISAIEPAQESLTSRIGRLNGQVLKVIDSNQAILLAIKNKFRYELIKNNNKDNVIFNDCIFNAIKLNKDFLSITNIANDEEYVDKLNKIGAQVNWILQTLPTRFAESTLSELFSDLGVKYHDLVLLIKELR